MSFMADDLIQVTEDSARSGFFLFSGTALATIIMAVATIFIGRLLGPELYGQYSLSFVIPQILFLATDFGITTGIARYTASFKAKGESSRIERLVKHALLLRALVAAILFAINYFLADVLASLLLQRPDLAFFMRIASTSILFQAVFTTTTSAFVGLDKSQYHALVTNVQALAKTLISLLLVIVGLGVAGAVMGFTASYLVGAITGVALLYLMLHRGKESNVTIDVSHDLKALIHYGAPLYLSILLSGLIPFYQNVVLSNFTTYTEIGNYKAAANFYILIAVLSVSITTALVPAFSKIGSTTVQKARRFFKLANKYATLIIVPSALIVIIYSGDIVGTVYGSTFQQAPLFLSSYCLIYFLAGLGSITLGSFYNGLGETKTTLAISLSTFIPLLVLSPLLTRAFKVQGLITGFLISSALGTACAVYKATQKFKLDFDTSSLTKIYIASTASCIPSLTISVFAQLPRITVFSEQVSIPVNLIVGALLYLGVYVTLLPAMKIITHSDLQAIEKVSQTIPLLKLIIRPLVRYEQRILRAE